MWEPSRSDPSSPPPGRKARRIEHAFAGALESLNLPQGTWVAAISGGSDSMALALLLLRVRGGPLVIAHYDHGLRGPESGEDARFVEEWALAQRKTAHPDLNFELGSPTIPLRDQKGNLEANARKARYQWLQGICAKHQANCLLTAHHADDQAETLLFRLMRGTGIKGLAGIAPRQKGTNGLVLARPLLELSKSQLLGYLAQMGQNWRQDSTNDSLNLARNRIRHQVLPQVKQAMGDHAIAAIASFAWHARNLDRSAEKAFARWKSVHLRHASAGEVVIALRGLQNRNPFWAAHYLTCCFREAGWPFQAMTRQHWLRLVKQARQGPARMTLPGGILSERLPRQGILRITLATPRH